MCAKRTIKWLRRDSRPRLLRCRTVHLSARDRVRYLCRGSKGRSLERHRSRTRNTRWREVACKMQLEGFIIRRIQSMEHREWGLIHSKRVRSHHKTIWFKSLKTKRQWICHKEIDLLRKYCTTMQLEDNKVSRLVKKKLLPKAQCKCRWSAVRVRNL